MDLLAGRPMREGSRGGAGDFKWDDVKTSQYRENYLGHSLMAPVGRWQQGRDLTWYAKDKNEADTEAARSLKEERRKIKQAEEEAMMATLGFPIASRTAEATVTQDVVAREDRDNGEEKERKGRDQAHLRDRVRDRSRERDRSRDRSWDNRDRRRNRPRERRRHRSRSGDRDRDRDRDRGRRRNDERVDQSSRDYKRRKHSRSRNRTKTSPRWQDTRPPQPKDYESRQRRSGSRPRTDRERRRV